VVGGLARSREFQHSHGDQARAWDPPVWDLARQAAKRPPRCPPQDCAHGPRGRRMAPADRLRGVEGVSHLGSIGVGRIGPSCSGIADRRALLQRAQGGVS
jgi:hypothetical protein